MAYASSVSLVNTSCRLNGADASCQSSFPHGPPHASIEFILALYSGMRVDGTGLGAQCEGR